MLNCIHGTRAALLLNSGLFVQLKAGNKEASEEELERLLDKIMVIFRWVKPGKQVVHLLVCLVSILGGEGFNMFCLR